jgi:DNA-binding response OmpR family regulator
MRRILIVDDDPHICLAIRAWLRRYGFKVAIADGGVNGLVALDNSTFDLMIVDVFMPNMRGFESIRVFHDHAPTVPLIAISGYAFTGLNASGPDFLRVALRFGATRCLRKPFRPSTLLAVIDQCLSEAEPHRKHVTTLTAVASALSEPPASAQSTDRLRQEAFRLRHIKPSVDGKLRRAPQESKENANSRLRHAGRRAAGSAPLEF